AGRFAGLKILAAGESAPKESAVSVLDGGIELALPLAGLVDLNEERARLEKEVEKNQKALGGIEKKLGNAKFVDNAPAEVVERERERIKELSVTVERQRALLARLSS